MSISGVVITDIVLIDLETKQPVSESVEVKLKCVNPKTGSFRPEFPYAISVVQQSAALFTEQEVEETNNSNEGDTNVEA